MGPILGPIAADVLTANISSGTKIGHIFRHAQKIDKVMGNVDEQQKYLSQVRTNLRDQAAQLHNQAEEIRKMKDQLPPEDQEKIVSLENMAEAYDKTADRFNQTADKIKPESLVRMVARNAWRQTLRQIRNEIKFGIKNELDKYVNPTVIKTLVGGDALSLDQILEVLVSGDISAILGQGDNKGVDTDELRNRVRDRIKDVLNNNKNALKNN
jgi:hypothetical protein